MVKKLLKLGLITMLFASGFSVVSAQVASIGETTYTSLEECFANASEGDVINLNENITVVTMIPVTKNLTLNLNGNTITNNVESNRLFRLSDIAFTINGADGSVVTPESNTKSFGFVDFRDASGKAGASTSLTVSDTSFQGTADDGALFAFRGNGQSVKFTNTNVDCTVGNNVWSIINGANMKVNIDVEGGEFNYKTSVERAGAFQCGTNSVVNFKGVKAQSSTMIFEVPASTATFTDCEFVSTAVNPAQGHWGTCVAASRFLWLGG